MKKLFFAVFSVMLALCSCQMDELDGYVEEDVLYVKIEDSSATKTYMGAGNKVLWSDGDQIAAYLKSYDVQKYQVTGESVGNSSAVFTKVSGNASSGNSSPQHNLAFYPYSLVSGFSQSGNNYVAEVTIPSSQTYNSESFDDGFFPMVAVSKDNILSFRNICGAVNLRLTGSQKVKSVTLNGNSGEKISGSGTLTVYPDNSAPYLRMKSSASSSVTLDCGSGVQLNEDQATSFVIVLPPVQFSQGFTITVTDSEGTEYEIKTDKSNSISRSNIHAVPVQKLGDDFGGETDALEYIDEYGINQGPGVEIDGVVWAPVNCGYHETDFPWGKLYQWGRKYGQGYIGGMYNINGSYVGEVSDNTVPTIKEGYASLMDGQAMANSNVFYLGDPDNGHWISPLDDGFWNSATKVAPLKTQYDPCPDGWRVPSYDELANLSKNYSSWLSDDSGQIGYWFSGLNSYTSKAPQVFLPAAGGRNTLDGKANLRGYYGYYWTSTFEYGYVHFLGFDYSRTTMGGCGSAQGWSVRCVHDDGELIPVSSVNINKSSLTMEIGETQTLSATISPSNANHKSAHWCSDDEAIATVDVNGKVIAVSAGTTTITAMAGMQTATCTVTVNAPASNLKDYVDEYGINHGPGIEIDGVVWAPVNCGYHETDFKYGKLYQWGRKYGQGYSGDIYDINGNKVGTYSDVSVPSIESGPVSLGKGQSKDNSNVFYTSDDSPYDWLFSTDYNLWNAGTESIPVKTEYDPCPEGWRVPTYAELSKLSSNRSSLTIDENGHIGRWLSGSSPYSSNSPIVFFSAAGNRAFSGGSAYLRCYSGNYWTSGLYNSHSYCLDIYGSKGGIYGGNRATGYSVRCVQDEGELIPVSSVSINKPSLTMEIGETQTLSATISPSDANHKTAYWWSEDESVATVDDSGKVTAVSSGVTTITAMAGMKQAACTVTVNAPVSNQKEYIDENGVNHGPGIEIDGVVWAPVNCGYHETDFKYGKLYQWGRKYGQGYSGGLWDKDWNEIGNTSDEVAANFVEGSVAVEIANHKDNENVFYIIGDAEWDDNGHLLNSDWAVPSNDNLWNIGTETSPVKTENDPCPEGWRIPTYDELFNLSRNHSSWIVNEKGQAGLCFSGANEYSMDISQIFLSAAGSLDGKYRFGYYRGCRGGYWSSKGEIYSEVEIYGELLCFDSTYSSADFMYLSASARRDGYSVRCVHE